MPVAHTDPQFMTQLTSVLDRLDPIPQEDGLSRRDRLLASATQVCEAQQIPVTPAMIAQAVDQELSQVPVAPSVAPTDFDFGWNRPTSLNVRAKQQRRLNRRDVYVVQDKLTDLDLGDIFGIGLFGGVLLGAGQFIFAVSSHSYHPSFSAILMTMLIGGVSLWGGFYAAHAWAWRGWKHRGALREGTVAAHTVDRVWTTHAAVRQYVRRCLTSGVPQLLEGDIERIKVLIQQAEEHAQAVEAEAWQLKERTALHEALMKLAAD